MEIICEMGSRLKTLEARRVDADDGLPHKWVLRTTRQYALAIWSGRVACRVYSLTRKFLDNERFGWTNQ